MQRILLSFFLFVLCLGSVKPSAAVVQWARQYKMPCSGCHAGFPRLNETGIRFRQLGYRFEEDEKPAPSLLNLVGPTWGPSMTLKPDDKVATSQHGVKIHVGGALTPSLAFLVQPTPGEKNTFNMAQALLTRGPLRLTAGRLYAWENGGGVGAGDRFPSANLPRMFTALKGVTTGGLGRGLRLDHTDPGGNIASLFTTDLSVSGPRTPTFGVSLTRRSTTHGLGYVEVFAGQSHLPSAGTARRFGTTASHQVGQWVLLGGGLYGSGVTPHFATGFLEADWLPVPRNLVFVRSNVERDVVPGKTRSDWTLGGVTQLSDQQRLDLDWTPAPLSASTPRVTARLRFFF